MPGFWFHFAVLLGEFVGWILSLLIIWVAHLIQFLFSLPKLILFPILLMIGVIAVMILTSNTNSIPTLRIPTLSIPALPELFPARNTYTSGPEVESTINVGEEGSIRYVQSREHTLYAGPSSDEQIISVLTKGTEVTLLGEQHRARSGYIWVKVRADGHEGWIVYRGLVSEPVRLAQPTIVEEIGNENSEEDSEPEFDSSPPLVTAHINLRGYDFIYVQSQPGLDASEVGRVTDPAMEFAALALSEDSNWVYIRLPNSTEGWVAKEFVVSGGNLNTLPNMAPSPSE
jgi:SH3-like domain-containing protein